MQDVRHRYFSVLLGCVPGENCPPYLMMRLLFACERAASVKVSGSGIFAPIQALRAAINTLQVIANNLPCTYKKFLLLLVLDEQSGYN